MLSFGKHGHGRTIRPQLSRPRYELVGARGESAFAQRDALDRAQLIWALEARPQQAVLGSQRAHVASTSVSGQCRQASHGVAELADAGDFDDDVADLQQAVGETAWHAADPGRRARGDHVTRFERERFRQVGHLLIAVVDHLAGVPVLAQLVVDERTDREVVRVTELVLGDDPRPERPVGVERLAHRHRRRPHLPVAYRQIVGDRVAGDHFAGAFRRVRGDSGCRSRSPARLRSRAGSRRAACVPRHPGRRRRSPAC